MKLRFLNFQIINIEETLHNFFDKMLLQKFGRIAEISTHLILIKIMQVIRDNI